MRRGRTTASKPRHKTAEARAWCQHSELGCPWWLCGCAGCDAPSYGGGWGPFEPQRRVMALTAMLLERRCYGVLQPLVEEGAATGHEAKADGGGGCGGLPQRLVALLDAATRTCTGMAYG
jgi:hypothetical protein